MEGVSRRSEQRYPHRCVRLLLLSVLVILSGDRGAHAFVSSPWLHRAAARSLARPGVSRHSRHIPHGGTPLRTPASHRGGDLRHTRTPAVALPSLQMQDQAERSQTDLVVQLRTSPCEAVPESRRTLKVSSRGEGEETEVAVFTQAEMTHPLKEKIFNVTKDNMADMYDASSWGWSDEKKWQSINNTALRFILAFREPSEGRWFPHHIYAGTGRD